MAMKKRLMFLTVLCVIMTSFGVSADPVLRPVNTRQVVTRQTPVNRVTDFFATLGKSKIEKANIQRERRETRRLDRLRDLQSRRIRETQRRLR